MSNQALTAVFQHSTSKGSARLVLLAMADEASDSGLLTAYRRSHRHLASKANVDEGTVGRAVKTLAAAGELLLLEQGNGRKSSDYRLLLPGLRDDEGPQAATPPAAARGARGGDLLPQGPQPATPIIPLSPDALPVEPERLLVVEDSFAAFWQEYPRRTAKPQAERAYRAALKKAEPEVIARGLGRWIAHWSLARTEATFIPHPATWLSGERWNDEPPPSKPMSGPRAPTPSDRGGASGRIVDL